MKALRRKDTKDWLSEIDSIGHLYTGELPIQIPDHIESIGHLQSTSILRQWDTQGNAIHIDLSDYELVEIEITVKNETL